MLGPRIAGHQVLGVGVCDALRDHERPRTRTRDRVPEAHRAANETNLVLWSSVELQTGVLEHQVTSGDVDVAGIVRLVIVQEQLRRRTGEREAVHVEPSVGIAAHAPACRTAHRRIGRHLEIGEHVVVPAATRVAEHGAGASRRARAAHDEFRSGFVHRLRIFGRAAGGGQVKRGARRHRHDRRRAVVVDGGRAEDAGVDRDRAGKRVRDGDAVVEVRLAVAFLHNGRKDRQRSCVVVQRLSALHGDGQLRTVRRHRRSGHVAARRPGDCRQQETKPCICVNNRLFLGHGSLLAFLRRQSDSTYSARSLICSGVSLEVSPCLSFGLQIVRTSSIVRARPS